jgi:hypothetical protein
MERQMSILQELQEAMEDDGIKGQLAAELHDITEQYNDGILTDEEYRDLVEQIADIENNDELAGDEITSRWVVNITSAILSVV